MASMNFIVNSIGGNLGTFAAETGEPMSSNLVPLIALINLPNCIKKVLAFIFKLAGEFRFVKIINFLMTIGVEETNDLIKLRGKHIDNYVTKFKKAGLDGLISPVFPIPAPLHTDRDDLGIWTAFTVFLNWIPCPAGVMPIKLVSNHSDNDETYFQEIDHDDQYTKLLKNTMSKTGGLPVSIQVSSLAW